MTLKWQIEQTFTINGLVYRTHLEWRKSIIVIQCSGIINSVKVGSFKRKTCIWSYCHVFGQYNMFKLPEGCENIGKSSYLNLPHIGFTLFSPIKGRSKKPWSGRSKLTTVRPLWLHFRPLTVSRIAWHTCIISQNVCTWFGTPSGAEGGENISKPSYFNLSPDIGFTLFTPIKGRIDSLTVYIYKAETCTNILRAPHCGPNNQIPY
jgi:hypothetical protein